MDKNRFSAFLISLMMVFIASLSLAQDDELYQGTPGVKKKYLNLTIGVPYDEPVAYLPANVKFEGDFKKVTRVSYAADLKILRFDAHEVGVATLTIYDPSKAKMIAEFRIDVQKSNLTKVVREIRALLGDIEGISIKIVNNKVVIDGQILLPRDMNRIYSVIKQYDGIASTIVTLSPLAQRKIAEIIEREVNNPEIQVRAVNGKFLLEGTASSADEKSRAEIIAKMYVPDVIVEAAEADGIVKSRKVDTVINLIGIKQGAPPPPGKIIQLVVHFIELNKNYTKSFRIQWMPDLADGSEMTYKYDSRAPGGVVSTITGTISNLLPKLNWAKEHGHARILQSSSLIIQDGSKGVLKNVEKIPYQTMSKEGQPTTNFADVGLETTITPSILNAKSDSITLDLNFSLSSLLGYTTQGPLTTQSALQTIIVVRSGQSAAVGGLISNQTNTNYNKLPKGVGSNPIISLYASKDFLRNQSQFVVFVTPIIKSSASAGAEKVKKKFRMRD